MQQLRTEKSWVAETAEGLAGRQVWAEVATIRHGSGGGAGPKKKQLREKVA